MSPGLVCVNRAAVPHAPTYSTYTVVMVSLDAESERSMRKIVALVTVTREHSPRTGFWKSRIRPLGLTSEGNTAAEADAGLLQMFWVLINTYRRRHGEEMVGLMLERAGIKWHWADEYSGRRRVLDTAPESCEVPRTARSRQPATNSRGLPLAA